MTAKKKARRYQAIQTLEDGIRAYLFINAMLENYQDADHEHVPVARFVAKATLNELLDTYQRNNGDEALQTFAASFDRQSDNDNPSEPSAVPSV